MVGSSDNDNCLRDVLYTCICIIYTILNDIVSADVCKTQALCHNAAIRLSSFGGMEFVYIFSIGRKTLSGRIFVCY